MKALTLPHLFVAVRFLLVLLGTVKCQMSEALIDAGELGKIQGSYSCTIADLGELGRRYYWFTGIPYAKPESYTGDNRFKPSEVWEGKLPPNDDGTFHADLRRSIIHCPQKAIVDLGIRKGGENVDISSVKPIELLRSYYSREGVERRRKASTEAWDLHEDCLTVTVSTPRLQKPDLSVKLPVLVFIHGGGFDAFWGSVFGGQRLLNHDILLVTINYRLGLLGSLNLGIDDAPGNAAVYDCISALKWVKKYIHLFGGDPSAVTISGQSAGAVLATTVFLSPFTKELNLINGVIGDSGSAMSVWANQKNPIEENLKVVRLTSCKDKVPENELPNAVQAKTIRDCMRNLTLPELIQAREDYAVQEHLQARLGYDAFVPSVQKSSPYLTIPLALNDTPAEILKHKRQINVPLMMGATRHDGSFVFSTTFYDYLVPNELDSDVSSIL